jgi:hypothetical protein
MHMSGLERLQKQETQMNTLDQKLVHTILQEIDTHLNQGILPVHNGHLEHLCEEGNILEYLLHMKSEGLISGDLVTRGTNSMPFRMTNIRLTYVGIRALRS